jgi:hypothetical protein
VVEIIQRVDGRKAKKQTFRAKSIQIAYNSWGHLTVRGLVDEGKDVLIVFNKPISDNIIRFCKQNILPVGGGLDDLPF